jgi:hypothetical protein
MVSENYVNRLREYITAECTAHARRAGEKGVNQYAAYTAKVLSRWGLPGFAAGQVSRWVRGEVKAELDGRTLQRLGLLKGYSDEPEEAGKMAWAWLQGEGEPDVLQLPSLTRELPSTYAVGGDVVDQIAAGIYNPGQLREIAIAAIDQLVSADDDDGEGEPEPVETPLTWLLRAWISSNGGMDALAREIGTTVDRADEIVRSYPMTVAECKEVSRLTRLSIATLAEWGLCPTEKSS